jgi:hypothetical protein
MGFARQFAMGVAAALSLAACGSDGGGGSDPEPVTNQQTLDLGKSAAQTSSSLAGIQASAGAQGAQGAIGDVGNGIMQVANQYRAAKLQAQAMQQGLRVATAEQAEEATEDTLTFENNHLSASLHYDMATIRYDYVADLDILPQDGGGHAFDGTFSIHYQGSSSGYDIAYAYDATYDALTLDGAGCAVGGSLSVDYDLSVSGGALDQLPAAQRAQIEDQIGGGGTITLTFGPNCGDVAAEGT